MSSGRRPRRPEAARTDGWRPWMPGAAVLLGFLFHYYMLAISRPWYRGALLGPYERIATGHEYAPFQYRLLVPWVVTRAVETGLSPRHVVLAVEGLSLFGGYALSLILARTLCLTVSPTIVALTIAFWGFGAILHPTPETFVAFLAVSATSAAHVSGRGVIVMMIIPVLALTRVDMLATFAVPCVARWLRDRRMRDLVVAIVSLVAAGTTVTFLARVYPAPYPPGVSVLQIAANLTTPTSLVALLFVAPTLTALGARMRGTPVRELFADDLVLLLLWPLAHVGLTVLFGRLEETRLWLPFAGLFGLVIAGWPAPVGPRARPVFGSGPRSRG